ncbi:hypothetical protein DFP72DRAFT_853909 [Ephemerocybe angulata]|uniref:Uncharacterized protein n=1 Tax=Ephemerocybe angulata TaxID=980116 RepID=A0A8H6HKX9_9AGAR|nr:hypothetical protein DFP72DRAFT_853909 [Tulosesus angulatus]
MTNPQIGNSWLRPRRRGIRRPIEPRYTEVEYRGADRRGSRGKGVEVGEEGLLPRGISRQAARSRRGSREQKLTRVDEGENQTLTIWYGFRVDAQRPAVGRAYTARPGDHFAKGFSSPAERITEEVHPIRTADKSIVFQENACTRAEMEVPPAAWYARFTRERRWSGDPSVDRGIGGFYLPMVELSLAPWHRLQRARATAGMDRSPRRRRRRKEGRNEQVCCIQTTRP